MPAGIPTIHSMTMLHYYYPDLKSQVGVCELSRCAVTRFMSCRGHLGCALLVPIIDYVQVYNSKVGVWDDTRESLECRQGLLSR